MTTATVQVKQTRSATRCTVRQRECLKGLGLRRVGNVRVLQDNLITRGLIRKVAHLIEVL